MSQVFRIEPRRSLAVLRHLLRRGTPVRAERLPGNPLRLRIIAVSTEATQTGGPTGSTAASTTRDAAMPVPAGQPDAEGTARELTHAPLLRWFLTRPAAVPGRE